MDRLISIDLKADFGFLKKPDTNEPVYLTFNMLHKPALLGIFGAILGISGYKTFLNLKEKKRGYLPEFYTQLKDLHVGIMPLIEGEKATTSFSKTVIKYNNATGIANQGEEKINGKTYKVGATLNILEQTLIKPSYRIFIILKNDGIQNRLFNALKNFKAEYLPYLGKNDFSLW